MKDSFKEYECKPVKIMAYQLKEDDAICYDVIHGWYDIGDEVFFKSHDEPEVGGWLVYINDSDVYYYSDELFKELYVVDN